MSNPNILYIIDTLGLGGAEKLLVLTLPELKQFEKHIIILNKPDTLLNQIPPGCKVSILNFRSIKDIPRISRYVKRYIRDNEIDIVHSHLYYSNIIARLAAPRNIAVFNTIHDISSLASYRINRMTLYLEMLTYKKRHHIIGVSNEVLNDFSKWVGLKGPSSVVYNFISDLFFGRGPKTEFATERLRLVSVGNLRDQKNYPYILNAFRSMPPSVTLDVYGDGSLREEFQQEIDTYKLNIRLCGIRNDMHEVYKQYDAFLMSSFYEGQGIALLEAMTSGLPVFISDIAVFHEVAKNTAIYFDLNNPEDLVNKINEALKGNIDLRFFARQAHRRGSAISGKSAHINKLMALYNQSRSELFSNPVNGNKIISTIRNSFFSGFLNLAGQIDASIRYFKQ
jgi:glycosyltransferase involved in cell wall biosynthesis